MLIELIIEFKWKGPGPPGCACTPTTGYLYEKSSTELLVSANILQ